MKSKVVAHRVAAATDSEVVQVVGLRFVLYRHSQIGGEGATISLLLNQQLNRQQNLF